MCLSFVPPCVALKIDVQGEHIKINGGALRNALAESFKQNRVSLQGYTAVQSSQCSKLVCFIL